MGLDDAGISEMDDITQILRAAEAVGTVPGGAHPVWATEFWWQSNPPSTGPQIPTLSEQARYIEEGIYLLWKQGIGLALFFQIVDQPDTIWKTGLYLSSGQPKPALTAFRFPLVSERRTSRKIVVWGRAPTAGVLEIQLKPGKAPWRVVARAPVAYHQVFQRMVKLRGGGQVRARIGTQQSLVWGQRG